MYYKILALLITGFSIYVFREFDGEQAIIIAFMPAAAVLTALILGSA